MERMERMEKMEGMKRMKRMEKMERKVRMEMRRRMMMVIKAMKRTEKRERMVMTLILLQPLLKNLSRYSDRRLYQYNEDDFRFQFIFISSC